MNFEIEYASVYELVNSGKNYELEACFILDLFTKHRSRQPKSLLDIGCGTGGHLSVFESKVPLLAGIELSQPMADIARKKLSPKTEIHNINFMDYTSNIEFDLIVSLFHVFSYQTDIKKCVDFLENARTSLKSDGILIFDYWNRSAWEFDPPVTRTKSVENEELKVFRTSSPKIDRLDGCVNISMDLFIKSKSEQGWIQIKEDHEMRAFTKLEVELLCKASGLKVIEFGNWLDKENSLKDSTWYAYAVVGRL
jgi:SAM-dependent methyltransferase